jgi:phosphohistidine phosphatase
MKRLYLQRHSDAEDGEQMDSARQLTGKGRVDAEDMAMFMQRQIGRVDTVICSPFTRATETADIMAPVLGCDLIVTTTALEPDGTPEGAWAEIERLAGAAEDILVVTHGPLVHELLAWLLEPHYQPGDGKTGIKFGFGECAAVHLESGHQGKLHWFCSHGIAQRDQAQTETIEAAAAFLGELGLIEASKGTPSWWKAKQKRTTAKAVKLGMKRSYHMEDVSLKRWVLGDGGKAGNCDLCEDNADRGWIDVEDVWEGTFGDIDEPPTNNHPHCSCEAEYKVTTRRVYEAARNLQESGDEKWVTIHGHPVLIGDEGQLEFHPSERVKRAMESAVRTGKHEQEIADKSEKVLSDAVGIPRTADNSPFDLRNDDVGIEVKTLVNGKNEKITMSKAALGRKLAEQRADGIKAYTVVVDRRAGGLSGRATYYYREGLGSFRLGSMTKTTLGELRGIIRS